MTHIEGNKLIAEFMVPNWKSEFDSGDIDVNTNLLVIMALGLNQLEMLKYHSSWNALMSVVEKIESLELPRFCFYEVLIANEYCSIKVKSEQDYFFVETNSFQCKNKIDAVWQTVIKFIQTTQKNED